MDTTTQAAQRRPPPEAPAPSGAASSARADMLDEGLRIVDAARQRGVVLRLLGGLAVRTYCSMIAFCERDYSNVDMVGLKAQGSRVISLFRDLGYELDVHHLQATHGRQLQFTRPCMHDVNGTPVHVDDHVDVFLDTLRWTT